MPEAYDVVIVGGGAAGLSAALVLGRCRRRVLICDAGAPRNAVARATHSYLTRDGTPPLQLLAIGRDELAAYAIEQWRGEVITAEKSAGEGFTITLADGRQAEGRKLLLATGLVDELPVVEGLDALWGRSVLTCPYCDGFEHRDQRLGAFGKGRDAYGMARGLTAWSREVALFTDGDGSLDAKQRGVLERNRIALYEERVARLEADGGALREVVLVSGRRVPCEALYLGTPAFQRSVLGARLGVEHDEDGGMCCGLAMETCVRGVYVAGNATRDVQLAIVAAAEGARAAFGINKALTRESLR